MPTRLTTTSYAVLGLLSLRSWSTYELAEQIARGWSDFLPRTARAVYNEPPKLVAAGLAQETKERVGERTRTVYSLTPAGREAFRAWLGEESGDPRFEWDALIRVLFAEHGTRQELIETIRSVGAFAQSRAASRVKRVGEFLDTGGPFPERLHLIVLVGPFLVEYYGAILRWAQWAEEFARAWPDVTSPEAAGLSESLTAELEELQDRFGQIAEGRPPPGGAR